MYKSQTPGVDLKKIFLSIYNLFCLLIPCFSCFVFAFHYAAYLQHTFIPMIKIQIHDAPPVNMYKYCNVDISAQIPIILSLFCCIPQFLHHQGGDVLHRFRRKSIYYLFSSRCLLAVPASLAVAIQTW